MALVKDYFEKTQYYKNLYGDKTVVLMQVGAFFEIYGLRKNKEIHGSNILDISQFADLNISDKHVCVGKSDVIMAGFRDHQLDKYLKKLQDNNYTSAIFIQESNNTKEPF